MSIRLIQAMDDGYIPLMMGSFDILKGRLTNTTLTESIRFSNFFAFALQDTSQRLQALEDVRLQAKALVESIDATLKE